jgi:hypothetical protein
LPLQISDKTTDTSKRQHKEWKKKKKKPISHIPSIHIWYTLGRNEFFFTDSEPGPKIIIGMYIGKGLYLPSSLILPLG